MLQSQSVLPGTLDSSILDGDLRIGDFVVRPLLKVVRPVSADISGGETTLPDKAMAVLVYLAQNARQVCERDEILDAVWGLDREAYDRVLDNAIREIRRALDDDARNPTYIQTIPKRGYRLLKPVESRLLERQRDSSGEFVPLHKASEAQVFQRVRRQRSLETPAPPPPDAASAGAPGSRRWPYRPVQWLIAIGVLSGLVVAAWSFGSTKVDGVTIDIDFEDLGHAVSTGEGAELPMDLLREELQNSLFIEHACGEKTLYRPDSWLRPRDFEIRIQRSPDREGRDGSLLAAEFQPAPERVVVIFDVASQTLTPQSMAKVFAREVTQSLDQLACQFEQAPDKGRACHCLEGSRRDGIGLDPQDSLDNLETAITLDPDLIPAYSELAEALRIAGLHEEGLSVLKAGLAKMEDPDSTEALGLRLQLARLLEDPAEEMRLLDKLATRHPDDPTWTLAKAGFLTLHQRKCEDALDLLEPLRTQYQSSVAFTIEMSRALWICGEADRMLDLVTEQVARSPRERELRRWLAIVLTLMGRYQEATDYATEAMALEPEASEPYWMLGEIADRQGHYAAAEAWYRKAEETARWPRQEVRAIRGQIRGAWHRGETSRCIELADELGDTPHLDTHETPEWLAGLCAAESGRLDKAHESLLAMESTLAGQASSSSRKAMILFLRGTIELAEAKSPEERRRAAALFEEAADSRPVRVDFMQSEAGRVLAELGETAQAEGRFQKALAVNPNHPWSLCRLGFLQQERGDLEAAAHSMRRGVEIFGPRLEDELAIRCDEALRAIESQ